MRRRSFLAALGASLVGTGTVVWRSFAHAGSRRPAVALVPLDDRPVNVYCPTMTAAVAGVELRLPPRQILGRFFVPGDGAAIADWLGTVDDVDAFVISVSMLAYGGLIASRTADPTIEQARANIDAIKRLRGTRPGAVIEVHDTIQRLALTSGDPAFDPYIQLLVDWAKLYDQVENLGQEELRPQLDAKRAQIPDAVVEGYLAARRRNHEVNRQMIEWVADGTIAENIRRHVTSVGASVIDGDADIVLAVNTPSTSADGRSADLGRFVERIADLMAAGQQAIVVDPVIVNKADHELVARLEARIDLAELLSYSGWNTAGNALGLALAHGTARWAYLQASRNGTGVPHLRPATQAHVDYLLHRFVTDDAWKNVVQVEAYAHARTKGWNPLSLTPEQKSYFDTWVRDRLAPITADYHAAHFAGHSIDIGYRRSRTLSAIIGELDSVDVGLPRDRLFEVGLEPHVLLAG